MILHYILEISKTVTKGVAASGCTALINYSLNYNARGSDITLSPNQTKLHDCPLFKPSNCSCYWKNWLQMSQCIV